MKFFKWKALWTCMVAFVFSFEVISQTTVTVQVYYGGYGEECSWNITRNNDGSIVLSGTSGTSNSYSYNGNISLIPGNYTFNAFDAYGDGWTDPAGWYQITPIYGISTGQVFFNSGISQATPFAAYYYSANDLGVSSWISPQSGPSLTSSQQITIAVKNYGINTANSYSVSYSINNGLNFVTQTITAPLAPGNTINHTFTQTANFSTAGVYHCKAVAHLNSDVNYVNDTLSTDINSIQTVSSFPWNVTFGSWPLNGWSQQGGDHTWALYSAGSVSCMYCNFYYWPSGNAVMITPPINMTTPSSLKFSWSKGFNQNYLNDELQVSISVNNGQSWTVIWDKAGADLNSNDGATSTVPGTFLQEVIDLSQYSNNVVYIKFNGISGYGYNLFIDNLIIETYPPSNLAASEWISPISTGCGLSATEPVTVKIQNLGAQTATNFNLGYSINGGQSYTVQSVTTSVAPGAYYTHTFSQGANFSGLGMYNCRFFVHIANDNNGINDTLSGITVKNLSVINSFPFTENFETGNTNFFNIQSGEYAGASVVNDGTNKVLKLEGANSSTAGWIGSYYGSNITTHDNAWLNNTTHHAWAVTCVVNASTLPTCELLIDLKQYYKYGSKYSWFRVLVNNVQISDENGIYDFNPVTSYSDPYTNRHFNLNAYAGTQFTLTLQGSNKLSSAAFPPGNVALIDNIVIHQLPGNDLGITGLVSPSSGCTLTSNEHFTVSVHNYSSVSVSNIQASFSTNGGSSFVTETISSSVNSGATLNYTFNASADLSAIGNYNLVFAVDMEGDSNFNNDSLEITIVHSTIPVLNISGLGSSYCVNASPVILTGSPSGGTFTGQGITGNTFTPSSLTSGTYTLTYSYTNSSGCANQLSQSVNINGTQSSFSGLSSQYCLNNNVVQLTGIPSGGVFSGQGINGSFFSPALAGTGTFIVTYAYASDGCTTLYNQTVNVKPVPEPNLGQNLNTCIGNVIPLSPGAGYSAYFWNNGASTSSINVTQSGTYSVNVSNSYGCSGSAQVGIVFNPVPVVELGDDIYDCTGEMVVLSAGNEYGFLWSNGANTSDIEVLQTGDYSVTVSNSFGCTASDQVNVFFYTAPEVNAGVDVTIYENQSIQLLATAGYNSYLWSDGSTNQSVNISGSQTGNGVFAFTVTITDNNGCTNYDEVVVTVLPSIVTQELFLPQGWSLFSLYIEPDSTGLSYLLSQVLSNVSIVKDSYGSVFWPAYNINTIGNLINGKGYQIRMLYSDTLQITGAIIIPEQTIINIPQGWSLLGYLRISPAPITTLLSSIVNNISIVKDEGGQVYWPYFNFNNIENMLPGKAYQINLFMQSNLIYPPNGVIFMNQKNLTELIPVHYSVPIRTGNNMTLGIIFDPEYFGSGKYFEAGIFTSENILAGSAIVSKEFNAVAVWGDDEMTPEKDGMFQGEKLNIRIWNGDTEIILNDIKWDVGNGLYFQDGISVMKSGYSTNRENSGTFRLFQNNPNPFADLTKIRFTMPSDGNVILRIYSISGESLEMSSFMGLTAGEHSIIFDAKNYGPGIYFYSVQFGDSTETKTFNIDK